MKKFQYPKSNQRSLSPAVATLQGVSLFDTVAVEDFEQIARAAAASPETVDHKSLLHVLISEWAKKDPLAAIAYAQELGRTDLIYEGLHQMAQQDPDGALNWIEQNKSGNKQYYYLSIAIYQGMAKTDPVGTIARVEQMPAGAQRNDLLSFTVDQWAKQDIHAAFDWLETTAPTPQFSYIYNQVMGRYIEQYPFQAAALIADMDPCENKLNLTTQLARNLAEQDVDYALEWVKTLDNDEKKDALRVLMNRWSSSDAPAALDYIMNQQSTPDYQHLFTTVTMNMAHQNPEALEDAFETLDGREKMTVAKQLASVYSMNDSDRGMEWIQSLEPGAIQDAALTKALKTYQYSNIPQAFTLSQSISSKSLRKETMQDVMSVWIPVDSQAAMQALNGSSALSAEEKEDLLCLLCDKLELNHYLLPAKP